MQLVVGYYDMSGRQCEVSSNFNKTTGKTSVGRPSDFALSNALAFRIFKRALPSDSGTYRLQIYYSSDVGGYHLEKVDALSMYKDIGNSTGVGSSDVVGTFIPDGAGGFYYEAYVDISRAFSYIQLNIRVTDMAPPVGGYIAVNFSPYNGQAQIAPPEIPGQDANSSMSDGIAQQVEQGDTIIELIKNTIQTISSQLTAFWNQLAGEFTNLYNKMNAHHSEDLAKVDEQISADRQNTDDLISNQDKNTDTMVNGYDNSGMNSDNDRLNSSLTEYGQAEDNLMGDVNKHIGSIDFDYSFDSIVNVVGSVSDFFQGIYERSGQFQIVINVCLILSLASCAVGIYRLKGGG